MGFIFSVGGIMRRVIQATAIVFLLMFVGRGFADNAVQPPITIQSELLNIPVTDEAGHAKTLRQLVVLLINSGTQPVTVLTDHLDQGGNEDNGALTITVGLNAKADKDGHLIVPSLSKLAPVTLQPGEAASISTESIDLSDFKSGKLNIAYEVSDFWGKRLSIWSGSAKSETVIK
jgi:hypothetical protein